MTRGDHPTSADSFVRFHIIGYIDLLRVETSEQRHLQDYAILRFYTCHQLSSQERQEGGRRDSRPPVLLVCSIEKPVEFPSGVYPLSALAIPPWEVLKTEVSMPSLMEQKGMVKPWGMLSGHHHQVREEKLNRG